MYNTMIATTGASLVRNLQRDETFKDITDYKEIAKKLNSLDLEGRRRSCAEINSIENIIDKGYLEDRKNLYFFISDTQMGEKIGMILKEYFKISSKYGFENVEINTVKKLTDTNSEDFKRYGLRNLVKDIARINQKHYANMIINATGGYKAQIAFALAIGQGMNIPVYYMFERFPTVIQMPPLPLSFDSTLYANYSKIFQLLEDIPLLPYEKNFDYDENGDLLPKQKEFLKKYISEDEIDLFQSYLLKGNVKSLYEQLDEKLKPLFDIERIDKEKIISLNAMGQAFVESATFYFNREKEITLKQRKNTNIILESSKKEGHSLEMILKNNVEKILNKVDFIERARVVKFSDKNKNGGFRVKVLGDELNLILNSNEGITHFNIETTARNNVELQKAKIILEDYLNKNWK
ncbi:hypothetical protein OSSY52_18930 [Tepiditoga spiralis]|uniref:CRISPR system ring nuclease SSO1393-like domain-containing protein n=1 Tax=Tepiditoga spiralis TaxID=2108365 RepID=A0A7G1GBF9_9BACT|nr:putative CRISPR-associated protein [Tepiditoga spiralis]BBE31752.1 hypothetical protein OSSY52_18930 [Tepiditoga spiralis]